VRYRAGNRRDPTHELAAAPENGRKEEYMGIDRSGLVMVKAEPFNAETPHEALREPVTPTPLHYVRSNFSLPDHPGTITIGGAVERPMTLTLDDLHALPATTLTVTLECAGNGRIGLMPLPTGEPWAGNAVGTARWTGVPLHLLLERAAPRAEGVAVYFEGADHGPYKGGPDIPFGRSLTLDRALDPAARVLVVWAMNDAPLPDDHGAPLRLLMPGWYGMASVKWLAKIEVLTAPYEGQFQTKSYQFEWPDRAKQAVTTMQPRALITDPAPGDTLPRGPYTVRGKAWSGTGPITAVEVSIDGAGEWQAARVAPPRGPYEWQEWSFDWAGADPGRHVLRARATDASGATQPDSPAWNRLGYGNNAVQVLGIDVR
jgi:DMSO/TMAO reductase YedYZ molybdopterin-dependent catalytic subunit